MKTELVLSIAILLLGPAALAQDSAPSLEDTTAWIVLKFNGNSYGTKWYETKKDPDYKNPWGTIHTYKNASASGCVITYTDSVWRHFHSGEETTQSNDSVEHFDLATLNSNSVHIERFDNNRYYPEAREYDETTYPQFSYEVLVGVRGKNQQKLVFESHDNSLAVRMGKAIDHAIALCGGKPEAF